jgi:tetratricopeptide (TPR) repeat protein
MKRVPWGWLLVGGVLLSMGLVYLYLDRRTQTLKHVLRGMNAQRDHDWQTAESAFSEALLVAPPLCPETATAYAGRGHARLGLKEYALAVDDFNEAIRRDSGTASTFLGRGSAYALMETWDRAQADLDESIRLDPKPWRAFYNRGLCYLHKRELEPALADFGEAINREPKSANSYLARSKVYAEMGDVVHADEDRRKAAELNASSASPESAP